MCTARQRICSRPQSLEMERTLVEVRLELAKRYARANALNRVLRDPPGRDLGSSPAA